MSARKPARAPFADWAAFGLPAFAAALAPWQDRLTSAELIPLWYQPRISIIATLVGVLQCFCLWRICQRLKRRTLVRLCLLSIVLLLLTLGGCLWLNEAVDVTWFPEGGEVTALRIGWQPFLGKSPLLQMDAAAARGPRRPRPGAAGCALRARKKPPRPMGEAAAKNGDSIYFPGDAGGVEMRVRGKYILSPSVHPRSKTQKSRGELAIAPARYLPGKAPSPTRLHFCEPDKKVPWQRDAVKHFLPVEHIYLSPENARGSQKVAEIRRSESRRKFFSAAAADPGRRWGGDHLRIIREPPPAADYLLPHPEALPPDLNGYRLGLRLLVAERVLSSWNCPQFYTKGARNPHHSIECRVSGRRKCLIKRLAIEPCFLRQLRHTASARHSAESGRDVAGIAARKGIVEELGFILMVVYVLCGVKGFELERHAICPSLDEPAFKLLGLQNRVHVVGYNRQ